MFVIGTPVKYEIHDSFQALIVTEAQIIWTFVFSYVFEKLEVAQVCQTAATETDGFTQSRVSK